MLSKTGRAAIVWKLTNVAIVAVATYEVSREREFFNLLPSKRLLSLMVALLVIELGCLVYMQAKSGDETPPCDAIPKEVNYATIGVTALLVSLPAYLVWR